MTGLLAERFETPDPLTFIVHLRKGIHYHKKAPMNGRELIADDIVFNFHRTTGMGEFTEAGPTPHNPYANSKPFASVTATDKYTVVFKFKKIDFFGRRYIADLSGEAFFMYPPEVIKENGNAQDWKKLVGTGPFELTDWIKGSSLTFTKNPDYWRHDEKFPENRLPYVDKMKMLIIKDAATKMAALRTGKLPVLRNLSLEEAENLWRTNPELNSDSSIFSRSTTSYAMDVRNPPFDNLRVRIAMQKAIDIKALNQALFNGDALTDPEGLFGSAMVDYFVPFDEWPEDVKDNFGYDPAAAEKLLDEAGYRRAGGNGIRFKTTMLYFPNWDDMNVEYLQAAVSYWAKIGVEVELKTTDWPAWIPAINDHTYKGMTWGERGTDTVLPNYPRTHGFSDETWNFPGLRDNKMDALVLAQEAATTFEEFVKWAKEGNAYYISQMPEVWGPKPSVYHFWQPWLAGYNAEYLLSNRTLGLTYARLWIDQELKESMGH
jgi:peptide/nickel transport system substrate-binding protein